MGTSIDMTELRQAEEARLDAQNKLSHANRVTTMGQLAHASIAHEVKQPASLRRSSTPRRGCSWLDRRPSDLECEVRQALTRIVKDANRSAEVINEILCPHQEGSATKGDRLEINRVVREVIGLYPRGTR